MKITVRSSALEAVSAHAIAIPLARKGDEARGAKRSSRARGKKEPAKLALPASVRAFDRRLGGAIESVISRGEFQGNAGETLVLYPTQPSSGGRAAKLPARVVLVGLGDAEKLDVHALRRAAGAAVRRAAGSRITSLALLAQRQRGIAIGDVAQALAEGLVLGSYRFDRYKEKRDDAAPAAITLVIDAASDAAAARRGARDGVAIAQAQNIARDLSNEPPNELTPAKLAAEARSIARKAGLRCRVLDPAQMKKLGMGAILAVGQGSANPPRMIVLEHVPSRRTRATPTLCVVGKGITFDTGGISIKPSAAMHEMKHDMSGAAAVVGALRAVAALDLPLHVVGVIGAAENMPSGTAYRPGDVVRAMNGKTIEILNTDAEGRVVLADALHYAISRFDPDAVVDLATLTGACVVALGPWASGVFTRDDELAAEIAEAGSASGETMWRMPLFPEHERAMKSSVADLKNAGARDAGASTAAGFLASFVGDRRWAHLDIAGTAWGDKTAGYDVAGATGVGVRTLVAWLAARARAK